MSWGIIIDGEKFSERYNRKQAIEAAVMMMKNKPEHEYAVGESYARGSWMVDCEATDEAEELAS